MGEYKIGNRYIKYGLAKGSADLIGIHRVLITPEMVGTFIGKFLSAEIKSEDGAVRKEQLIWRELIRRFGGESVIWRDPSEAEAYLRGKVS